MGSNQITEAKTIIKSSYSASEVNTGKKWVDGKDIYKKTINFGSLPNNTTKLVAHGVVGLSRIIDYTVVAQNSSTSPTSVFPIPLISASSAPIILSFSDTSVSIQTTSNRTDMVDCFATIYYTK